MSEGAVQQYRNPRTRAEMRFRQVQPENTKQCTKCGETKPATSEFWNKHKLGKLGLSPACKSCRRRDRKENHEALYAKQKEWKAANRERHLHSMRAWADNNREYKKEQGRIYRTINRDRCRERKRQYHREHQAEHYQRSRAWILANTEKHRQLQKAYYERNRDKSLARVRLYQTAKSNRTPRWLTKHHKRKMATFYRDAKRLTELTGVAHHVDHIIPLRGKAVSGLHVPWNLQILRAVENTRKSNRLVEEAIRRAGVSAVYRQRTIWEDPSL